MLKKTITYADLDDNPVTEDFYFNISKPELADLGLSVKGGFANYLERLTEANDGGEIMSIFKKIIALSVGRRSEDNRRFLKSDEITRDFMQSDAYSVLFMELIGAEDGGASFIRAILPKDVSVDSTEEAGKTVIDVQLPEDPAWIRENRDPTTAEFSSMTREQMQEAFRLKNARQIDAVKVTTAVPQQPENLPDSI